MIRMFLEIDLPSLISALILLWIAFGIGIIVYQLPQLGFNIVEAERYITQ